jgi:hypothetical protein
MMTEIRKADPVARRRALWQVVLGAAVGAALILGLERCRAPLRDWLLSEPAELPRRVRLVLFIAGSLVSVPLIALAMYLWAMGARVIRAGEFPPPGYAVIRDTPVLVGTAAVSRGRSLKALALSLAAGAALWWLLLWWWVGALCGRAV